MLGNAAALRNGALKASDLPIMRVWQDKTGKIWTLDHRRLAAFRLARLNSVPVRWATPNEIAQNMWKMTTKNGGVSIELKLGNGKSVIIN